jgi:phosphoribosylaminoimidazole-succinocarboxamide synthase
MTDTSPKLPGRDPARKGHESEYRQRIRREIPDCLTETDLPLPEKQRGKVRDQYRRGDTLVLVTTDRQSAFDRVLATVPFKGQVLNLTSAWWFEKTASIIPNHVLSIPHPNVTAARFCKPFPIEFVVRGYITGSTETSLWTRYSAGERTYCGITFPEGLKRHQELETPALTPTTKEEHDRPISPEEILAEGWMTEDDWNYCSGKALELFSAGQAIARDHGLILVDTKYEMGRDGDGTIRLIDEIHTPDSSRYWIADTYDERMASGESPENIDKEFLRRWFVEHCDPYRDEVLPAAPEELIEELAFRYITLYETITGAAFPFPDPDRQGTEAGERLRRSLQSLDL